MRRCREATPDCRAPRSRSAHQPGNATMRSARCFAVALLALLPSLSLPNPSHASKPVTGVVTGHLYAESGDPIPNGSVVVKGTYRGAITDGSGAFRIVDVPAGTHTVVARVIGYKTARRGRVRVASGETTSIEIQLKMAVVRSSPGLEIKGMRGPTRRAAEAPHSLREDSLALFGSWSVEETKTELGLQRFTDSTRPHLSFHEDGTYEHHYGSSAAQDPLACSGRFTAHPSGGSLEGGKRASLWIDLGRCAGLMISKWLVAFSGRDTIVMYPGGGNMIVSDGPTLVYVRDRATLLGHAPDWIDPCPPPVLEMGDWWRVRLQGFSMSLPPDYHEVEVEGKDCDVGSYVASDATGRLFFGLCGFPNQIPTSGGFARFASCTESIGGKVAMLISGERRDGDLPQMFRYYVEADWKDVRPNIHLSLWGEARNMRQVELLLTAMRTVRFEEATR